MVAKKKGWNWEKLKAIFAFITALAGVMGLVAGVFVFVTGKMSEENYVKQLQNIDPQNHYVIEEKKNSDAVNDLKNNQETITVKIDNLTIDTKQRLSRIEQKLDDIKILNSGSAIK